MFRRSEATIDLFISSSDLFIYVLSHHLRTSLNNFFKLFIATIYNFIHLFSWYFLFQFPIQTYLNLLGNKTPQNTIHVKIHYRQIQGKIIYFKLQIIWWYFIIFLNVGSIGIVCNLIIIFMNSVTTPRQSWIITR